ncbi:MAG: hypothetical protein ACJ8OJ_11670 [Povalibacter sp.]
MVNPISHDSFSADPSDRRAAILHAEQERAAARRQQLEALVSPNSLPEDRIKLWEQLHGLNLPRDAEHKLLRVIARDTALNLSQVHDEQLRRSGKLDASRIKS